MDIMGVAPTPKKYRKKTFVASIVCLALDTCLLVIYVGLFVWLKLGSREVNIGDDGVGAAVAVIGLLFAVGVVFAIIAAIVSLLGFLFGRASIKHLPTTKMTAWARVITYTNLAIAAVLLCVIIYAFMVYF